MSYSPLSPHFTEDFIRRCLDGTFTRVDYEGRVRTVEVDESYAPSTEKNPGGRKLGQKIAKQTYWSPDEEDLLIRQRMLNRPFAEIAWSLSRSLDSTKKHYQVLKVRGRV